MGLANSSVTIAMKLLPPHGFAATQGEAVFSECVGDFDAAGGGGGERFLIFPLSGELVAFNWLSGGDGLSL